MESKTIAIISAKGGTGKTMVAASFAKFLAGIGKKVLLVDTDMATNGLTLLFLDEINKYRKKAQMMESKQIGMFEKGGINRTDKNIMETKHIIPSSFTIEPNFDIIPATYKLGNIDKNIKEKEKENLIKYLEYEYKDKFDFIILDTEAGTDAEAAVKVADSVIIVSEFDGISIEGVERLKEELDLKRDKTWILYNKVLPEFVNSIKEISVIERKLSPIAWDAEVVKAYAKRELPINMKKANDYTIAVMQTIESFFGKQLKDEINKWKSKKEKAFQQPSQKHLEEIEEKILKLEEKRIDLDFKLRDLKITNVLQLAVIIISPVILGYMILQVLENIYTTEFSLILSIGISISLIFPLILVYKWNMASHRNRQKQIQFEAKKIDQELENLKTKKDKYAVISDYSLEQFLKEVDETWK